MGQGKKVGLMVSQELYELLKTDLPGSVLVEILSKKNNLAQVTSNLFMEFGALDKEKVDVIYVENFPETYIGAALMNRLYKAAGENNLSLTLSTFKMSVRRVGRLLLLRSQYNQLAT